MRGRDLDRCRDPSATDIGDATVVEAAGPLAVCFVSVGEERRRGRKCVDDDDDDDADGTDDAEEEDDDDDEEVGDGDDEEGDGGDGDGDRLRLRPVRPERRCSMAFDTENEGGRERNRDTEHMKFAESDLTRQFH